MSQPDGTERTERVVCAAFPDRIPDEIAYGDKLHLQPYPGDRGIQYEKGPFDINDGLRQPSSSSPSVRTEPMAGRIYLLDRTSQLTPMEEAPYDSERLLQELLAKHPGLLAGEQIDSEQPRRWLLVTREMSVPGEQGGGGRWSLDHLFLDQDAVPTLVEIKRSGDTRIRREVVGQMLDYAANAVVYWPVEDIRAKFEARCQAAEQDPDQLLSEHVGGQPEIDDFWQRVKTNLQAGRIRMVFVADIVPPELRRIVEFLNEQMDPAEVLAIEIKQYVGNDLQALVPRVIGQTESAKRGKKARASARATISEAEFLVAFNDGKNAEEQALARGLIDWAKKNRLDADFFRGQRWLSYTPLLEIGSYRYYPISLQSRGLVVVQLDRLRRIPPFDDSRLRADLLNRLQQVPGLIVTGAAEDGRSRIPVATLARPDVMQKFVEVLNWMVDEVRRAAQL